MALNSTFQTNSNFSMHTSQSYENSSTLFILSARVYEETTHKTQDPSNNHLWVMLVIAFVVLIILLLICYKVVRFAAPYMQRLQISINRIHQQNRYHQVEEDQLIQEHDESSGDNNSAQGSRTDDPSHSSLAIRLDNHQHPSSDEAQPGANGASAIQASVNESPKQVQPYATDASCSEHGETSTM